ncbi:uncharacterized protein LOC143066946 [Mytilus galloprovincialis]|uniref:uncharacterized protein LOC143066946 n=1 Tax=Mytilus galloprovincialis TaxID=29158 RepID=UPI003F7B63D2
MKLPLQIYKKSIMDTLILIILVLISSVHGVTPVCPSGYVYTGSACVSVGAIIGACIGAIVGLVFFIVLITFLCCKSKKGTDGTVLPQTGANIAVVGQQQYGQPASGQQPAYGQQ